MFKNIFAFLSSLNFIDYVLFFTIVFLIVLIASLIYFIKINNDEFKKDDLINDPDNLMAISNSIKKNSKPVEFTSFEKEQEESAIISYEELLSNTGEFSLNYLDEKNPKDDLDVKMVDLNNMISTNSNNVINSKSELHVISLKKEEEFLKTLKELYQILN